MHHSLLSIFWDEYNGGDKEGVLGAQDQGSHPQKSCLIKTRPEGQFGDSVPRVGE